MQTKKSRVQILVAKFTNSIGLPFQKLLPESLIEDILVKEKVKYRNRLFSPIVTLWAFLSQVQYTDKSCHNAVSRIIAWLALLAYNLLRKVMWFAGTTHLRNPLRLSLQGARQHLNNFRSEFKDASTRKRFRLYQTMLALVAHKLVPERKGRAEARAQFTSPQILSFNETTSPSIL